ncbi:ISNCY family transposase, partial [Phenylobacterium sp.]|uniref:ISNCY family transposase n=1 Tax=Phenylobacterium sp. TaxID=1871053 RepID=UPI0025D40874
MPVRIMSDAELTKYEILRDVDHERTPVRAAAQILGLTERQVWRLLKAYRLRGADGLISRKRGRPSNRKTPDDVRLAAMALVKERYADFGPTFAAEKLGELHDLHISRETLRAWMVADGLWQTRRKRRGRVYQPRYRRDCLGELVQIDGSEHRWFEDCGPKCTLLVFIDDATSRLMHLQFAQTESTFSYFSAARAYLETHGKPIAFYSDKHSVFRVNRAAGATTDG